MVYIGVVVIAVIALFAVLWLKAEKERREIERHSIEPDALFALMNANNDVLLLDVRQPLDVLAEAEMIPGARRIPPKEIEKTAGTIPKDRDLFVSFAAAYPPGSKKAIPLCPTLIPFVSTRQADIQPLPIH